MGRALGSRTGESQGLDRSSKASPEKPDTHRHRSGSHSHWHTIQLCSGVRGSAPPAPGSQGSSASTGEGDTMTHPRIKENFYQHDGEVGGLAWRISRTTGLSPDFCCFLPMFTHGLERNAVPTQPRCHPVANRFPRTRQHRVGCPDTLRASGRVGQATAQAGQAFPWVRDELEGSRSRGTDTGLGSPQVVSPANQKQKKHRKSWTL